MLSAQKRSGYEKRKWTFRRSFKLSEIFEWYYSLHILFIYVFIYGLLVTFDTSNLTGNSTIVDKLGNIYQWDSEKVISYATRVRELGEKILDAHKANNDTIDENFQAAIDSDIRDCFLRGLKTEIESKLQGVHNFKDTVNSALEMERKISATAELRSAR